MLIAASMSSSSPMRSDNDSPNRQIRHEDRRYRRYEARNGSRQRTGDLDSPTRQLVDEFTRFYIFTERQRQRRLNEQDAAQKKEHDHAIECARMKHEEVRIAAEKATQTFYLELERQRQEKLEAQTKALEEARRAKEELEARQKAEELENARRREEHARKLEAQNKEIAEIEARTKLLQEQQEAKKKELEEKARQQLQEKQQLQEQAQAEEQSRIQRQPQGAKESQSASQLFIPQTTQQARIQLQTAPPASASTSSLAQSPVIIDTDARTAEHHRYLDLHRSLKKMRQHMSKACEKAQQESPNSPLGQLQEMRRTIQKSVGQLTADKGENMKHRQEVVTLLVRAANIKEVTVDARHFIIDTGAPVTSDQNAQISGAFIYLLNQLIKIAIENWVNNAATTKWNAAEPYGVLLAAIFSRPEFGWNGHSFADIILAKMHSACPVLFGSYGPENKQGGRTRLGWRRVLGEWITPDEHYERMKGIGAGWASVTLRNFRKVKTKNPLPPWHFWRSMSCIINTPSDQATPTHFIVLKAMMHNDYVKSFIGFYGQTAATALRKAVVEFPASAPKSEASQAIAVLRDTWRKELNLEV